MELHGSFLWCQETNMPGKLLDMGYVRWFSGSLGGPLWSQIEPLWFQLENMLFLKTEKVWYL